MKYLGEILDDKDFVTKEYVDSMAGGGSKNVWYGTCPTAAYTATKVVSTDTGDFTLTEGNMLRVVFTEASTALLPKLQVDGQTDVLIQATTSVGSGQYRWQAGEAVDFVYDGSNFLLVNKVQATTSLYGITRLSDSIISSSTDYAATSNAVKQVNDAKQDKLTSTTDITVQSVTIGDHATPIGTNGTTTNTTSSRGNSTSYAGIGLQISLPKGVWLLTGTITFESNTTGRRAVRLTDAGTAIDCSEVVSPPANGAATALHTSAVVENTTSSSKTYAMQCYQNSGAARAVTGELRYVRIA